MWPGLFLQQWLFWGQARPALCLRSRPFLGSSMPKNNNVMSSPHTVRTGPRGHMAQREAVGCEKDSFVTELSAISFCDTAARLF